MTEQTIIDRPDLRDPRGLWVWLRGFLIVYLVMLVPSAVVTLAFLVRSEADPNYSPEDPIGLGLTFGAIGAAALLYGIFIVCIVLTVRISYRMVRNLEQLRSTHTNIGRVWAVGSYFVPFANLGVPVIAVGEVWKGTFSELEGEPPKPANGKIGWWWTFWLLSNFADNIANRVLGSTWFQEPAKPTHDALMAGIGLSAASVAFSALACLFMLRVFGELAAAQSALVQKHGG